MKKLILNNWPLKLLAIIAAIITWVFVISLTDPSVTRSFLIPIELQNEGIVEERGRALEIVGDQNISIKVTKARSIVNSLQVSDFSAVADFSKMYEDTQVPVIVTSKNASVTSSDFTQEKFSLEVRLEELGSVTFPIEYVLKGDPESGYAVDTVTVEPTEVTITGPKTYVDVIKQVTVEIDVENASSDFSTVETIKVYDGNEKQLYPGADAKTSMSINGKVTASVKLSVVKNVPVIIEAVDRGEVAVGFQYIGARIKPDVVTISGTRAVIGQISSIVINDISVAGLKESKIVDVDLVKYIPDNVTLREESSTISVELMIEPYEEKTISIATEKIKIDNLGEGFTYVIPALRVQLPVRALASDLRDLDPEEIELTLNCKGLAEGSHNVVLAVKFPSDGYILKGNVVVNIRIVSAAG